MKKWNAKFLHFRTRNEDGEIGTHGGATVAYVEGENGVTFATAWCHDLDRYNKELGRIKSQGRLLSKDYSEVATHVTRDEFIAQASAYMEEFGLFRNI